MAEQNPPVAYSPTPLQPAPERVSSGPTPIYPTLPAPERVSSGPTPSPQGPLGLDPNFTPAPMLKRPLLGAPAPRRIPRLGAQFIGGSTDPSTGNFVPGLMGVQQPQAQISRLSTMEATPQQPSVARLGGAIQQPPMPSSSDEQTQSFGSIGGGSSALRNI